MSVGRTPQHALFDFDHEIVPAASNLRFIGQFQRVAATDCVGPSDTTDALAMTRLCIERPYKRPMENVQNHLPCDTLSRHRALASCWWRCKGEKPDDVVHSASCNQSATLCDLTLFVIGKPCIASVCSQCFDLCSSMLQHAPCASYRCGVLQVLTICSGMWRLQTTIKLDKPLSRASSCALQYSHVLRACFAHVDLNTTSNSPIGATDWRRANSASPFRMRSQC